MDKSSLILNPALNKIFLILVSTAGDGEPPISTENFANFIRGMFY